MTLSNHNRPQESAAHESFRCDVSDGTHKGILRRCLDVLDLEAGGERLPVALWPGKLAYLGGELHQSCGNHTHTLAPQFEHSSSDSSLPTPCLAHTFSHQDPTRHCLSDICRRICVLYSSSTWHTPHRPCFVAAYSHAFENCATLKCRGPCLLASILHATPTSHGNL